MRFKFIISSLCLWLEALLFERVSARSLFFRQCPCRRRGGCEAKHSHQDQKFRQVLVHGFSPKYLDSNTVAQIEPFVNTQPSFCDGIFCG
jgi:hypothetical protein